MSTIRGLFSQKTVKTFISATSAVEDATRRHVDIAAQKKKKKKKKKKMKKNEKFLKIKKTNPAKPKQTKTKQKAKESQQDKRCDCRK